MQVTRVMLYLVVVGVAAVVSLALRAFITGMV